MNERELFARILGVRGPWRVAGVELDTKHGEVVVRVEADATATWRCPTCGAACARHDHRLRRWRHLDACEYKTMIEARVPRVNCAEHGVLQVEVPWAEPRSGFTAHFEALVIDWLKEANIAAVARLMNLSWDEVDGIQARAVLRGLARRKLEAPKWIGVDETSFRKRHRYVSVVSDLKRGRVLFVNDDRRTESLSAFYRSLPQEQLERIELVAMDMHAPYIQATREHIPDADRKIVFDRFHVAKHLNEAVDQVRRAENRELLEHGDRSLVGTKYLWLRREHVPSPVGSRAGFRQLARGMLRTARAWAIKEAATTLWRFVARGWAERGWRAWISWALRSRLEPIQRAARMIRDHLFGIVNASIFRASNALSETINGKIQRIKRLACGFRNQTRFKNAILFHLGGLDLYPSQCRVTHTGS